MAGVTEERNFKFCLMLTLSLNLNSHMWQVATILDSTTRGNMFMTNPV